MVFDMIITIKNLISIGAVTRWQHCYNLPFVFSGMRTVNIKNFENAEITSTKYEYE